MKITLRSVTANDIGTCEQWAREIKAEQYQSHYYPRAFNGRDFPGVGGWAWYIILADGEEVGSLWLEKEKRDDKIAILGILLGREDHWGRGVGREAIGLALKRARKQLGFKSVELNVRKDNSRAIACYRRCGFSIVGEGDKGTKDGKSIPYWVMKLDLS